ncbi:hypothetical protein [Clostridium tagluense]|uniref:hypothetical protein n=1 Tax=Clostridium tagluense TaxID=360422 RepID=UPI001CF57D37|nr:hypothetical protein [Clostridium tagluense]MCB2299872.1 hypothetical protein [Clostridium tagluense]
MDRTDIIKDIVDIKEVDVADGDKRIVAKANKSLNNIIKGSIKKAQQVLGDKNRYKEYVTNNREHIRAQLAINKEVSTIAEAIILIKQVDFRYIFGLDVLMEKAFACEFINEEQRISFAFKTGKEAEEAVDKEIEKYPNKEITISGFERFGMYVRELIIKGRETEAWISYSNCNKKYLYIVGNKDNNNYAVTHTLDLLDLYQIFIGCDFKKAVQELSELLDIRVRELDEIRIKYIRNKVLINTYLTKDKFPVLCELIWEHIPKLQTVLDVAIDKLYYHRQTNNKWVLSSSMEYLAGMMNKRKSTINPIINTFVLLGLLTKDESLSSEYLKANRNEITYFYISEYTEELFKNAEELSKVMLYGEERITASAFSYTNCIGKFGRETANSIFKDKVTKAKAS